MDSEGCACLHKKGTASLVFCNRRRREAEGTHQMQPLPALVPVRDKGVGQNSPVQGLGSQWVTEHPQLCWKTQPQASCTGEGTARAAGLPRQEKGGITQCLKLVPREVVGGFGISFPCFLLFYSVTLDLFLGRPNSRPEAAHGAPGEAGEAVWRDTLGTRSVPAPPDSNTSKAREPPTAPGLSTQNLQSSSP